MPNTPATSRPDVKAIKARVAVATDTLAGRSRKPLAIGKALQDITALITHIEALETVYRTARTLQIVRRQSGMNVSLKDLDIEFGALNEALAALGDADG